MFEDFGDFRFPRVFGKEFFPFRMEMKDVEWVPQLEVVQDKEHLTVRCDLPGMKKDDIKVEIKEDVLTISGMRNEEAKDTIARSAVMAASIVRCRCLRVSRTTLPKQPSTMVCWKSKCLRRRQNLPLANSTLKRRPPRLLLKRQVSDAGPWASPREWGDLFKHRSTGDRSKDPKPHRTLVQQFRQPGF